MVDFRIKTNPSDAILERALRQLIDLLAQEAQPIHEGQRFIRSLLSLAVSKKAILTYACIGYLLTMLLIPLSGLQWTEWMMQKTNKQDNNCNKSSGTEPRHIHDKQTYLLIVQSIEICAGRVGEAVSVINNKDSDRFIHLACTICDSLNHKVSIFQVNPISK